MLSWSLGFAEGFASLKHWPSLWDNGSYIPLGRDVSYTSETKITVGQWTKSGRKYHLTNHFILQSDKMAGRKPPPACGSVTPLCCPGKGKKGASTGYASIAHALLMLDESEKGRMRHKLELCYLMAKKGIAFEECVVLYEPEARHDGDLSHAYKIAPSVKLCICALHCRIPTSAAPSSPL